MRTKYTPCTPSFYFQETTQTVTDTYARHFFLGQYQIFGTISFFLKLVVPLMAKIQKMDTGTSTLSLRGKITRIFHFKNRGQPKGSEEIANFDWCKIH